ncbi:MULTISPECIES: NAD+ synthase [Prochlorococcus]|uniref:Glutamine-dependent NAD(+) synthetase n=1 Tax=Prochlorococcus marinus str. MIT 9116 TaxID=167544 RepID=A0A0A1ZWP9_PROMR|nr:NAD+ synthase [Prochlorococcus marinus]KGF91183.1 NAD synthetase [Prochlorococcus marinus str. MIT 9107]KGF92543.1 NAD synthetase [Prochlorococcus marinus str. MIT 9116]KGF93785.1 NAD synthetase [Prochlorococcus marinus str. MIT 9123]
MKFLLAQINPVVGDLGGNAKKILDIASKASSVSADFVITPELSLWGYPANDLLLKKNLIKNQYQILDQLALDINKKYGNLSIAVGIAEIINDSFFPNLYNSIALLEGGEWKIIARKIILPTYEVFDEKRYFRSEEKVSVLIKKIKNKTWRLGFSICEDLWVNEDIEGRGIHKKNPIIDLKKKKVDILINLSASPYTFKKSELRFKVSSFAAQYLQVPLIYVNQIGANDNLIFDGNSFILDKNGSKIKQLKSFSEDLSSWKIEQTKPEKIKSENSEMSSIFDALVLGVKDYAKKCGFKTALIGLSGGIDSALVSAIATAALGSDNIYCISMPSKWSSSHSKSDAKDLARRLKINFNSIPIENLMNSFEESFIKSIDFEMAEITNQNIQSRIRGTLLMALANQEKHLLLSTGNKSELAVGYCTLYGDMNGGLSVIGDLYKSNVFKLCNWLDSKDSINHRKSYMLDINVNIIGENIRTKAPSAELGPDQLDTDSLPPYSILDNILRGIIEEKKDLKQLEEDGFKKELILKIISLIKKAEFKRKQAPPILKLSNQSLGSDWRVPIAISY